MATSAKEPLGTQSVERALSLLDAFTPEMPERRISELMAFSGLGQSTVSRLVGALVALEFLDRDTRAGLYRVGPRAITLGGLALNSSAVYAASRQIAQNLAYDTGLGANVAELRDGAVFYLCHFEGRLAPKNFDMAGRRVPPTATGLGKALLHELDRNELAGLVGETFPALTPRSITSLGALVDELDAVRNRGYAVELEEFAFGRACVAAPIRDKSGATIAALSISGPLSTMSLEQREQELASAVVERADEISIALGYHGTGFRAARSASES